MGLEDLVAIQEAAEAEAEEDARQRAQLPVLEAKTCTLSSGSRVVFDVPNTRKR
jgi:hypothetical protein